MPPRSDFDSIDDTTRPEAGGLAVGEAVPVEDALEQNLETAGDAAGLPWHRTRPLEAAEADVSDQDWEIGYDDDHDDY